MPKIYPVIHHKNWELTFAEADKILRMPGINGVFLISHQGDNTLDWQLVDKAAEIKRKFPQHNIGVNLLSVDDPLQVVAKAADARVNMVWFDNLPPAAYDACAQRSPLLVVFAGVAFKHQLQEADPVATAQAMRRSGIIPTTSGQATGIPPSIDKIRSLSESGAETLGIASGMTPDNVAGYAPYLSHILVATGVSRDAYRVDEDKLRAFVAAARRVG